MTDPQRRITSLHNPRVKAARGLRDRSERDRQGRILIDGAREIGRALAAGVKLTEVFVCEPLCRGQESRELLHLLPGSTVATWQVSSAVFERLSFGQRSEGVLAVAETPHRALADLRLPPEPLVAVLEGVEKPGNVGAVLRSADGAGLSAVVLASGRTDLFNPNCIRASLGTVFSLPVAAAEADQVRAWLQQEKLKLYAAQLSAETLYCEADLRGRVALLLGSEAAGLSARWQGAGVTPIKLPMRGVADSLNVSAAAAVLFYEAWRQRGCG